MKKMNKKGFTLVEIMIVVAIIGLLAAIGIPSFQKARATSVKRSMDNNARIVMTAAEQYAMENALATNALVTTANIIPYLKGGTAALQVGVVTIAIPASTAIAFYDQHVTNVARVLYSTYTSYN